MTRRWFGFMPLTALLVICALLFGFAPAVAQGTPEAMPDCGIDVQAALEWMRTLQNEDGGFTNGFAPESDLGATADAVTAIASAAQDVTAFAQGDNTPISYLETRIAEGAPLNAGLLGKVLLAVQAAGLDPRAFGGVDLVAQAETLLAGTPDDSGIFGWALVLIGVARAEGEVPESAVAALTDAQTENGGWGFVAGIDPDTNTTALALIALDATGQSLDPAIGRALEYLRSIQNADTGWPYQNPSQYGTESDSNSTALVTQALVMTAELIQDWGNPHVFLATFQAEDGSFNYQLSMPGPNFLATVAAIPAMCEVTLWEAECLNCPVVLPNMEATPEATAAPGN